MPVCCRSYWTFNSGAKGLTMNQKNHLNIHTSFVWSEWLLLWIWTLLRSLTLDSSKRISLTLREILRVRGFLFLSPKGMCAVDNSLSCQVHLDWSRGTKEGGFRCSSKWCDHGLTGKSAKLGKSIYFFFCAKRIAHIPSVVWFSMTTQSTLLSWHITFVTLLIKLKSVSHH